MSRFFQISDDSDSSVESSSESERVSVGETPQQTSDQPRTRSAERSSSERSVYISDQLENLQPDLASAGEHRELLLVSLLEEHYRTRAAEFLNSTNPGRNYTRNSPEVQPLAQHLFNQASATLSSTGILNGPISPEALHDNRAHFLAGLDQLGAGATTTNLSTAMQQLSIQPVPATDQQLLTFYQPRPTSHYQNSFRELCLLGRGGFGRVFKCHNLLDKKTYAVKKIPLSPQMSKSFCEGRHDELHHVLLEVQTLAELDHANIVRYHTTWVEEPQGGSKNPGGPVWTGTGFNQRQLLLGTQPHSENAGNSLSEPSFSADQTQPVSCGFVFAEDSEPLSDKDSKKLLAKTAKADKLEGRPEDRSEHKSEDTSEDRSDGTMEPSANASDIFTDGAGSQFPLVETQNRPEPESMHTHALYIQMSLYPMTLFHYLSTATEPGDTGRPRHCYHLAPSLHIFSAILAGLRYLWAKKLVHRDVKPRNIFLSAPEAEPLTGYCNVSCSHCHRGDSGHACWLNPRIGDFGLVTQLAHGELPVGRNASKAVGTPLYRPPAPESKEALPVVDDQKVDIFALGVVFVELLCPFSTSMERADALAGLQKGVLPSDLRRRLEREGFAVEVVDGVLEMAEGMVDPNATTRWSGERIAEVAKGIEVRISTSSAV